MHSASSIGQARGKLASNFSAQLYRAVSCIRRVTCWLANMMEPATIVEKPIELADKKGLVCTGRWLIGWYRLVMIGWSAVNDKRVETFQTMAYIIYEENCNTGAGLPLFRDTPDALRSLRWSSLQWW
ncbi:uncharacterized protein LOC117243286 isoform X1 [Bombus vosnesenskii]|uniref:Uncharacterized protein LOC117243286 isoform X1 n=1 Tax=Bombus vosnesenskii TaxID=207650 RepID=A0A6J3LR67_9HYME|nr:uncharacterized protein LOC117243286 isoform X1 [Bombus vosnesenskii]